MDWTGICESWMFTPVKLMLQEKVKKVYVRGADIKPLPMSELKPFVSMDWWQPFVSMDWWQTIVSMDWWQIIVSLN